MGSAPSGSRRSTESSGFNPSETDFGSLAPGSAPALPASAKSGPAAPVFAATAPSATALAATTPAATLTKDLFRQYMQAYLEDRQNPAPAPAPGSAPPPADAWEKTSGKLLKATNPDLYYGNSHMECYFFCQQCEDYFNTVGGKDHKRVLFVTSFLKDRIFYRWQQHKAGTERSRAILLSWKEFKALLRKSLGASNAFVGSIWSRMRGEAQYQLKEVQDWAAHLEQLRSILLEFDADCAPIEGQLSRTFYDWLRPSIKL